MRKLCIVAALSLGIATPATAANLLLNGDFEASNSPTATPPGWTNIGHSDGVIAYSQFNTPAYDGNFFYDLGGFGNASGPIGDGIQQTVATMIGAKYRLTFGLSSEDVAGNSRLDVLIGNQLMQYDLASFGTFLGKGFTTYSIDYTANSALTTISFVESLNTSGGNNDPMIDGVIFSTLGNGVPEPATWAMMIGGMGMIGATLRRRSVKVAFA